MPAKRCHIERFWEKVDKRGEDDCWEWLASLKTYGYGQMKVGGKMVGAHRVSYEIHHGDAGSLYVLHKCDNPKCVNPKHLFLGTHQDNMIDMWEKGRHKKVRLGGETHPNARLKAEDVLRIKAAYERGDASQAAIAAQYGVSQSYVSELVNGKKWKPLPEQAIEAVMR